MPTTNPKKANPRTSEPAQDWHPADIIAALHKAGWTLRALAKEHGLTATTSFSRALTCSYPLNEKRIANAIGIHPKEIWPSRYFKNGEVKPRGFRGMQFKRNKPSVNGKDQAENSHESA